MYVSVICVCERKRHSGCTCAVMLLWWSEDSFQELVPFYHGFLTESSPHPSLEFTERGTVVKST